jgi:hypothetical protein
MYQRLPDNARDAFFELVLFPTKACAQVNELYIAAAKNRLYASQGRASANDYAARVRELFQATRTCPPLTITPWLAVSGTT